MKRLSIFLILVALIAGMVGCGPSVYDLTITSTAGGLVTTPGVGTFPHDAGTVVSLHAIPDTDYHFVRWIGDVSTIADVEAATTIITMNGDHNITACFEADFMVTAGSYHTVGLKADGTLVAVGRNDDGQCDVGNWTDIIQVGAGDDYTVGLKSDGTVIAVGRNNDGQCDVGSWNLI